MIGAGQTVSDGWQLVLRDQHADALPILHALMKQLGDRPPRAPPPGGVGACARRIHAY
jgi:hypothetical protein